MFPRVWWVLWLTGDVGTRKKQSPGSDLLAGDRKQRVGLWGTRDGRISGYWLKDSEETSPLKLGGTLEQGLSWRGHRRRFLFALVSGKYGVLSWLGSGQYLLERSLINWLVVIYYLLQLCKGLQIMPTNKLARLWPTPQGVWNIARERYVHE